MSLSSDWYSASVRTTASLTEPTSTRLSARLRSSPATTRFRPPAHGALRHQAQPQPHPHVVAHCLCPPMARLLIQDRRMLGLVAASTWRITCVARGMNALRGLGCAALFLISFGCGGQSDSTTASDDSAAAGESSGGADPTTANQAGERPTGGGGVATSSGTPDAGGTNSSGGAGTSAGGPPTSGGTLGAAGTSPSGAGGADAGGPPSSGGTPGAAGANPSGGASPGLAGASGSPSHGVGGTFPTCEPIPFGPDDFVTRWSITAATRSITLPLVADGDYDFVVDWGDGTSDTIPWMREPDHQRR